MTFTTRRGRPKQNRPHPPGRDLGTPELAMKRALGVTDEALDLCLTRGLITPEQHWAGVHLRWLHTLRYGAPGVSALDLTDARGVLIPVDDPTWREEREKEYADAIAALAPLRWTEPLLAIIVHDVRPAFLRAPVLARRAETLNPALARAGTLHARDLAQFRACLDVLTALWGR